MSLFSRHYPSTLRQLTDSLTGETVAVWSFDDAPTRLAAEARFAARGITAQCHSAYKPLLTGFRERVPQEGLIRADITYPRHPEAGARRFLLECYPLAALYPDVAFTFAEGAESRAMPAYHLRLTYADESVIEAAILAPNRLHEDYAGLPALSPCGWVEVDGKGRRIDTEYEQLFHQAMEAISDHPWGDEPYFPQLHIAVTLPVLDEPLPHGDEVLSLREALHEEFYFAALEVFQRRSGRPLGDRHLQPGQILPEIRFGTQAGVEVAVRPHDPPVDAPSGAVPDLEGMRRPLTPAEIAACLATIPGEVYIAQSVIGREIRAVHHRGSDRGVIISAGQHANETSSPVGTLRAVVDLARREGAHFAFCPLENPDGYALHQRLIRDNPRHMHHAARYTALGDDLEYRDQTPLYEKAIRIEAETRVPALLHMNFHGYPAHEWTRPLSGYVPRGFEMWTIPKGFFLIMRHLAGWEGAARALMDRVTRRLGSVPGLRARNDAQIALFEQHAGETPFEMLNGFPVMISEDTRHSVPMTLITEYPDETIYGAAFIAAHDAQRAAILAGYDSLQELPDDLFPDLA